jgi:hypothetical protein
MTRVYRRQILHEDAATPWNEERDAVKTSVRNFVLAILDGREHEVQLAQTKDGEQQRVLFIALVRAVSPMVSDCPARRTHIPMEGDTMNFTGKPK